MADVATIAAVATQHAPEAIFRVRRVGFCIEMMSLMQPSARRVGRENVRSRGTRVGPSVRPETVSDSFRYSLDSLDRCNLDMVWQLQDAEQRFSEVVDRALSEGPQWVTRGPAVVVVLAIDAYRRLSEGEHDFKRFLTATPDFELLDMERSKELRTVDL
jgi:prevent-host-death family protein